MDTSASDDCMICGKSFTHNCRSYTGFKKDGSIVMVGDCCAEQMQEVHAIGVYFSRKHTFRNDKYDVPQDPKASYALEDVWKGITALQEHVNTVDQEEDRLLRMAGLFDLNDNARIERNNVINSDDGKWFEQHPDRSHRLRVARPEEITKYRDTILPNHDPVMLIRQIEPGKRVRFYAERPSGSPLPTDEAVLHAMFDKAVRHYQSRNEVLTIDTEQTTINISDVPTTKWHNDG